MQVEMYVFNINKNIGFSISVNAYPTLSFSQARMDIFSHDKKYLA